MTINSRERDQRIANALQAYAIKTGALDHAPHILDMAEGLEPEVRAPFLAGALRVYGKVYGKDKSPSRQIENHDPTDQSNQEM